MERAEWLKKMRSMAEALYDHFSPLYWVDWGVSIEETHQEFLQKFLELVGKSGVILSAGCGAGLNDGILLEAGHSVVGIDQSEGMLKRARQHYPSERFPQLHYEKMRMQEMTFREEFQQYLHCHSAHGLLGLPDGCERRIEVGSEEEIIKTDE